MRCHRLPLLPWDGPWVVCSFQPRPCAPFSATRPCDSRWNKGRLSRQLRWDSVRRASVSPDVHLNKCSNVDLSGVHHFLHLCSVGELRLRLPRLIESYDEDMLNATTYGHPCLQQALNTGPEFPPEVIEALEPLLVSSSATANVTESEDCERHLYVSMHDCVLTSAAPMSGSGLYLNVFRPANMSAHARLPVLFVSGLVSQDG